ncbi:hypothetical protein PFLG_00081 [Plasmodium falciparum RAJ116]|uniref:Uncharacterized protein n=1 Tax=Plasmodium falciparum RAJ116 TaxID=580058 RepID=A0A0L0CRQ7_PLAFA|nr:hypothetical protein PFLG_00081 [Plasmodium falciparum RAJ116]
MSYVGDYCASKCKVGHKVDDMISKIMMNNDKLENYDDINEKSNSKNDDISDNSSKHEFGNSKYNNDDISDDSRHKNNNKRYKNHHISHDSSKKLVINDIIVHTSALKETKSVIVRYYKDRRLNIEMVKEEVRSIVNELNPESTMNLNEEKVCKSKKIRLNT